MTETYEPDPPDPSTLPPATAPYIPSSGDPVYSNEPLPIPRSTIDGIHGTRGDEPIRWVPDHPDELPPHWLSGYNRDPDNPHLFWPAPPPGPDQIRPPGPLPSTPSDDIPGGLQRNRFDPVAPAAFHNGGGDEKNPGGTGEGRLDVNTADLEDAAEKYAQLQAAARAIGPQAVDEVQRIIATHGPMGYPVAVGLVNGLARRQARLERKADEFGTYSTRFLEHSATYRSGDHDGATLYRTSTTPDDDWFYGDDNFPDAVDPGGAGPGDNVGPAIPDVLI